MKKNRRSFTLALVVTAEQAVAASDEFIIDK